MTLGMGILMAAAGGITLDEDSPFTKVFDDAPRPGAAYHYAGMYRDGLCLQQTAPDEQPTLPLIRIRVVFIGTDERDWEAVKRCLAPEVHFDMTSMTGATPGTLQAQEIVDAWEEGLKNLQAIHHQAGNFIVQLEGDAAEVKYLDGNQDLEGAG